LSHCKYITFSLLTFEAEMVFAIVDIETTGAQASGNSITEIAITLTDGREIIDQYETLLQPDTNIPHYITQLTGIDNEMLEDAPRFEDVAQKIDELTKDCVFVAHNVNFDYSFIKKQFDALDIKWTRRKLCTVRLSKKAFPGFKSYSLGNLCKSLDVINERAHRAMGDTKATTEIFHRIHEFHPRIIEEALKRGSGNSFLPNHLDVKVFQELPEEPGVYYFLDKKGKIIYIGKAKNIKKRIRGHFSGKLTSKRRQDFIRDIYNIDHQLTGTELIALLKEDFEIKKNWPKYNRAQKFQAGKIGIFSYEDQKGYMRLCIKKVNIAHKPIRSFSSMFRARQWLFAFAESYEIDFKYCNLPALENQESPNIEVHNENLKSAILEETSYKTSIIIEGNGRSNDELSFVWIDQEARIKFGFVPKELGISSTDNLEDFAEEIPKTEVTDGIIKSFLEKKNIKLIQIESELETD